MNKKNKIISTKSLIAYVLGIFGFFVLFIGLSYSFFNSTVIGGGSNMVVTTALLSLVYEDGNIIGGEGMIPGDTATKTFTVENNGTDTTYYDIKLEVSSNNFDPLSDLIFTLSGTNGINILETTFPSTDTYLATGIEIESGALHMYTLNITFRNTSVIQDSNQNKTVNAKVVVDSPYAMTAMVDFDGYLFDDNGSLLTGKTVVLHSDPVSTTTDLNGYFSIPNVEIGMHNFKVLSGNNELINENIKILPALTETEIKLDTIAIKDDPVMITLGETIEVDTAYKRVSITILNGTVSPSYSQNVFFNNNATFNINPSINYKLEGTTVNCDSGITGNLNTTTGVFTFSNVIRSGRCILTLAPITKTVNIAVLNGSASPASTVLTFGSNQIVSITANSGYTTDGASVVCDSGITATMNNSSLNITQATVDGTCTVTLPVGIRNIAINVTNGTSNKSSVSLLSSESTTATITPNAGYIITSATVECTSGITGSLSGNTLSISNPTASGTCTVNIASRYACAGGYTLQTNGTYINNCSTNLSCPIGTINNGICYTTDSSVFSSVTRYCCGSTCYSSNGTCTSTSSSTYSASIGCNSGWTYDSGAGSCYRSSSCSSGTKTSISGTYRCVQKTYGNATICNNSCSNYCSGANCISGNPSCSSGSLSSNNNLCYSSSNIKYTCNSGDSLSGTTCTHTTTSTYSRTASTTNSCISTWTLGSNQCYKTATCEYGTLDNGVCYTTDSNIRSIVTD